MTTQPSKPHLMKLHGIWHCAVHSNTRVTHIGTGYTPLEAYEDWKKGV